MTVEMPDELSKALIEERDELGVVLRAQLYIENKLDELLLSMIPKPEHFHQMQLNYSAKVKLACALGFDSDFKGMLLALGSIRNKFAHNLDQAIDEETMKNLHSVAHPLYRERLPEFINSQSQGSKVSSFNEVHPRDQFTTLVIALWVIMTRAIEQVEEHYGT